MPESLLPIDHIISNEETYLENLHLVLKKLEDPLQSFEYIQSLFDSSLQLIQKYEMLFPLQIFVLLDVKITSF